MKKVVKAIALLSGGLDSILAAKLILDQGIDVEAINFSTVFYARYGDAQAAARRLGIKLVILDINKELFELLKNPQHGFGRHLNPCIDCHALMLKKASLYMKEKSAKFLVTGDVLGERPRSQRKDSLQVIDKDTGLAGFILRPLSAKLLEPTLAEQRGLVARDKLLAIEGRSRKPQMQLARELGIDSYPSPAGGCLLTEEGFANRMKDLMVEKKEFNVNDVQFLKIGRHFRLKQDAKLIVGRNEKENKRLLALVKEGDLCFYPVNVKGPTAIGKGIFSKDILPIAASIVARYSDSDKTQELEIAYKTLPSDTFTPITISPAKEETLDSLRI